MTDSYYDEVREWIAEYQKKQWDLHKWTKRPALVNKKRTKYLLYTGQKYDSKKYELDPNGWDHDHCRFCFVSISDCDHDECINEAYTNSDGNWVCPECYQHLIINGEDPEYFLKPILEDSSEE